MIPAVMRIYIVRHGETEANVAKVIQGHRQVPLNAQGRQQAAAVAARLGHEKIDSCYASDLSRARETAEIIAAVTGHSVTLSSELRERCYGEFEGRPMAEYEAAMKVSGLPRHLFRPRGGENYGDVESRIASIFRKIVSGESGRSLLFVGHSGSIRALIRHIAPDIQGEPEQDNACLNMFEIVEGEPSRVILLNDTAHLDSIGSRHRPATE